jgi:hypothetical protein
VRWCRWLGTAPTNNNFVDADYNRETGLVGNGSTKYLDSKATDARLAFYSIGESLDLALLDARVTALVTAIGAAI